MYARYKQAMADLIKKVSWERQRQTPESSGSVKKREFDKVKTVGRVCVKKKKKMCRKNEGREGRTLKVIFNERNNLGLYLTFIFIPKICLCFLLFDGGITEDRKREKQMNRMIE